VSSGWLVRHEGTGLPGTLEGGPMLSTTRRSLFVAALCLLVAGVSAA